MAKKTNTKDKVRLGGKKRHAAVSEIVPAQVFADIQSKEEAAKQQRDEFVARQVEALAKIRKTNIDIERQYRDLVYGQLANAYAVFLEIENSAHADYLYEQVRITLRNNDVTVRSDTTNAACIVRLVFPSFRPKQVYDYGTVMLEAQRLKVPPSTMAAWLKKTTMTALIAQHKQHKDDDVDSYKGRMQRARVVVLRAMENFEVERHMAQIGPVPMHEAEAKLQYQTNTAFLLANVVRRRDRESFYADYYVYRALPSNYEFFMFFVNRWASDIQHSVEFWEQKMDDIEQATWRDELWNHIHSAELDAMQTLQQKTAKKPAKRDKNIT